MTNGDAAKVATGAPMSEGKGGGGGNGYGFDGPDPTKNVLDLVQAAIKRLDDLAIEREHTLDAKLSRLDSLRQHGFAEAHELIVLERNHIKEVSEIRADYERQLRMKESERIDAIRAVDVQAVQRATEVSGIQAQTLAAQVQASAEALRTQVATTAVAQTTALAAALEPIQKDISELRKTQYEQQGQKAQQLENRTTVVQDRGQSQWVIGLVFGLVITVITTVIGIALKLMG